VSAGEATRRRFSFHTADVFTAVPLTGNALAVFPEAKGLNADEMQAIARETGLSETVFVFPPDDPRHTRKVRIFTPRIELPFAGHPTLGTAHVLVATGRVPGAAENLTLTLEEGVGLVRVRVRVHDGAPVFTELESARLPEPGPTALDLPTASRLLSLEPGDLTAPPHHAETWSTGVPFLFLEVRTRGALQRVRLDHGLWARHVADSGAPHVFAFTLEAVDGCDVSARMFAPAMGVDEDPATGAAAAALAGLLGHRDPRPTAALRWTIRQGVEMGRPSTLHLAAEKQEGRLTSVRVGGQSVLVSEGTSGCDPLRTLALCAGRSPARLPPFSTRAAWLLRGGRLGAR
jgi:trans-2,3-dihydro-3-hydroxyanthranilate isomerase